MILSNVTLWANYNVPGRGMVSRKVVMVDANRAFYVIAPNGKGLTPAAQLEHFFSLSESPLAETPQV